METTAKNISMTGRCQVRKPLHCLVGSDSVTAAHKRADRQTGDHLSNLLLLSNS